MSLKNNKQNYQNGSKKKSIRHLSKKFTVVLASALIGTNLVSLLVGSNNVLAAENKARNKVPSITEPLQELNKIANGEFENNYASNKGKWDYKKNGLAKLIEENDNSYGIIEEGNIDDYILQIISTTPGKKYRVSADIKVTTEEGRTPGGVYFTVKQRTENGQQGKVYEQLEFKESLNEWTKQEFTFTAAEDIKEAYVGIVKWAESDANGDVSKTEISIDNVKVIEEDKATVVWADDFTGNTLDQSKWGYELGSIRGNEQQHYVDSKDNVFLEDGNLVLKVTERAEEDQYKNPRNHSVKRQIIYNSGSVRTHGKQEFLYGRIEMKAKLPKGKGAFPAFWTLGSDFMLDGDINPEQGYGWPSTGEIDIMEIIGAPTDERLAQGEEDTTNDKRQSNKIAYGTPHFYYGNATDPDKDGSYAPYALGGNLTIDEDFNDDYHVFGINWSPDKIEWYVDGVVYNTMYLTGDERAEAAAATLNRPQYIQLNLATGGNWAGDAGLYLAEDNTTFEIDWVRWTQNEEQKAAADEYYADNPNIKGVRNVTMIQGETPDLLEGITVDKENYVVDYSIDDEYMFSNSGGNTNVTLKVSDSEDLEGLQALEPGVYNIHYSAFPKDATLNGWVTPVYKVKRETVLLTVLPSGENEIKGNIGDRLSSIELPEGWKWQDENQVINKNKTYKVIFNNIEQGEEAGKERTIITEISGEKIAEKKNSNKKEKKLKNQKKILNNSSKKMKNYICDEI